jgi:hypothetical protein
VVQVVQVPKVPKVQVGQQVLQDHKVLKGPKEVKEPKAHLKEPKVI